MRRIVIVSEWETRGVMVVWDIWASHPPLWSGVFRANMRRMFAINRKTGAGEEIRTLDPNLGKVGIWRLLTFVNIFFNCISIAYFHVNILVYP